MQKKSVNSTAKSTNTSKAVLGNTKMSKQDRADVEEGILGISTNSNESEHSNPKRTGLTLKKQQVIEQYKKCLGIVKTTCDICDISRTTFYEWCSTDEIFKGYIDDCNEGVIDVVESKLMQSIIQDMQPNLIQFYLKTKGAKRGYVEQSAIDITSGGKEIALPSIMIERFKPK